MTIDPSQYAKFLGRIACLLRRRLLGSPTRHRYFGQLMNVLMNLSSQACALLDHFAKIGDAAGLQRRVSPAGSAVGQPGP
jgi:hypothetical protein